jgi:hypothetical protein
VYPRLAGRLSFPDVERRTIFVDTFGVKATDFAIAAATRRRLFERVGRRRGVPGAEVALSGRLPVPDESAPAASS